MVLHEAAESKLDVLGGLRPSSRHVQTPSPTVLDAASDPRCAENERAASEHLRGRLLCAGKVGSPHARDSVRFEAVYRLYMAHGASIVCRSSSADLLLSDA